MACAASASVLCDACRRSLRRVGPALCARCGSLTLWPVDRCRECSARRLAFASARSAVLYTGAARPLVTAWKERGLRPVAALAADLIVETVDPPAADVITYIPADPDRLVRRGHHPPGRLARELGARWGLAVVPLLIRATGPASPARQTGLLRADRLRNVRDAFLAVASPPSRVVLVDDVYTTGATAGAGARALVRAGATRVDVVTFARTPRS